MLKTLVITGWKVDFICAAALIYQKIPNTEIMAASRKSLPYTLRGLAKKNAGYDTIYILGVPLTDNPKELLSACRLLHNKKTAIIWLSTYPVPHKIPEGVEKYLTIPQSDKKTLLCRFTADYFKISRKISQYMNIERVARFSGEGIGNDASKERCHLIEAGMSRFRRFQDSNTLIEIIHFLADNTPLGTKEKNILAEYSKYGHRELRGASKSIIRIKKVSEIVGKEGNCSVLITGETGTGKETVANLIHGYSPRNDAPFIAFNCADLSPQLLESRLFGHEKGAFTGAEKSRKGAFELADGGTLFLDEVGELPLNVQAGLLRVLQEQRFFKLGGEKETAVDVRIIAATNRNLPKMIKEGKFREDLFYRLNVVNIHIPPLRDRPEDIQAIADSFMINKKYMKLTEQQLDCLKSYSWPGNIRELRNFLERAIVLRQFDFPALMSEYQNSFSSSTLPDNDILKETIQHKVQSVYEKYHHNKTHAAKALGITVNTLKKYLIQNNTNL